MQVSNLKEKLCLEIHSSRFLDLKDTHNTHTVCFWWATLSVKIAFVSFLFLFCATLRAYICSPSQASSPAYISSSGFFTAKGNLVSSILYPQPTNFRFYQDSVKFLLILGFVGKSFNSDLTLFVSRLYEDANLYLLLSYSDYVFQASLTKNSTAIEH